MPFCHILTEPTLAPTRCYDYNGVYTNDGYERDLTDIISSMTFTNMAEKKITTEQGQFVSDRIVLTGDKQTELYCNSTAGCNGAEIIFIDNIMVLY